MIPSVCSGHVIHHRKQPSTHRFKYKMSWFLFNLDQLDSCLSQSKLWSRNRFNWMSIHDKDYIKHKTGRLEDKAKDYFSEQLGREFRGHVMLFTHPRCLNYGFNSVSFYLAYENDSLVAIASEINNTPWNQQYIYFHRINDGECSFYFSKSFHISPFVDMDTSYVWTFDVSESDFNVSMKVIENNDTTLNVALRTQLQDLQDKSMTRWGFAKPFQCLKMVTGIYWQALKLYLKKTPFYSHPEKKEVTYD